MNKIHYKTRSVIIAALVMFFLMMLVVTVKAPMEKIYETRIERCQSAIEDVRNNEELSAEQKADKIAYYNGLAENRRTATKNYMISMGILFVLLIAGVGYTYYTGKSLSSLISAVCLLTGIGITYQYALDYSPIHLVSLILGIICMVAAYTVWQNVDRVPNWMFYSIVGLIAFFMLLNIFGPKAEAGHNLWVSIFGFSIQPSEFVKILLILLGAASFGNKKRGIIYFVTFVVCCLYLILIRDLGNAIIMFAVFVVTSLLLWDNKKLSILIILAAAIAFFFAVNTFEHVQDRFEIWGNVMVSDNANSHQQRKLLQTMILAGNEGFGVSEGVGYIEYDYAIETDTALAGASILFGRGILIIAILAYLAIMLCSINMPIFPNNYLVVSCSCMLIACQVLIHYLGSIDVLPFTGVCLPFVSSGGSSLLSSFMLIGFMAASLFPNIKKAKEKQLNAQNI